MDMANPLQPCVAFQHPAVMGLYVTRLQNHYQEEAY